MAHAQIAFFARLAKENTPPNRVLAGQKTLLSRTMHDIRYDELHDEFVVNNPFAYAVLVFDGGASGEDPPKRIIQGPKTTLGGSSRLEIDPVNNEILVPEGGGVLVFDDIAHPAHPYLIEVWRRVVREFPFLSSYEYTEQGYGIAFAVRPRE